MASRHCSGFPPPGYPAPTHARCLGFATVVMGLFIFLFRSAEVRDCARLAAAIGGWGTLKAMPCLRFSCLVLSLSILFLYFLALFLLLRVTSIYTLHTTLTPIFLLTTNCLAHVLFPIPDEAIYMGPAIRSSLLLAVRHCLGAISLQAG